MDDLTDKWRCVSTADASVVDEVASGCDYKPEHSEVVEQTQQQPAEQQTQDIQPPPAECFATVGVR